MNLCFLIHSYLVNGLTEKNPDDNLKKKAGFCCCAIIKKVSRMSGFDQKQFVIFNFSTSLHWVRFFDLGKFVKNHKTG